jgi:hypothetical protein
VNHSVGLGFKQVNLSNNTLLMLDSLNKNVKRNASTRGAEGKGLRLYVLGLKTSVLPTSIWHSQMCQ